MSESAKSTVGKKKGFNIVLILIPVALIAAAVLAFTLPPTHALLVNGPLKPLFAKLGSPAGAKSAGPSNPLAEIKRLNDQLESDRQAAAQKDQQIAALQSQIASQAKAGTAEPASSPTPKPSPTPVSEDIKRIATYWAAMDAEKAADIAARLPNDYVKTVFAQMPADAVAEIINAMPPKSGASVSSADLPQPSPVP